VISTEYPYLRVRIVIRGQQSEALALVDTGFSGDVVVPVRQGERSLEAPDAWVDWEVADGAVVSAPIYYGTVEILGLSPVQAAVTMLGEETLLGIGVVDHYRVTFDHGQRLIVED
jgi:predicted aspartyl protease